MLIRATSIQAQSLNSELNAETLIVGGECGGFGSQTDIVLARRAITALRRLERHVIVYRSLDDFETNSPVARVSFETFAADLGDVTAELEQLLGKVSDRKLRTHAWGPADKREIEEALETHRNSKALLLVHSETSTGVLNDVRILARLSI